MEKKKINENKGKSLTGRIEGIIRETMKLQNYEITKYIIWINQEYKVCEPEIG